MSTPVVVLIGIVFLAILGFGVWYLNRQAALAAVNRQRSGLSGIFAGLGDAVGSIGGVID